MRFWVKIIKYSSLFNPAVHSVWSVLTYRFIYGYWLIRSGRGHQCAVFWEGPMGMSVCCIKRPAERDAATDWLTQDPAWVNTPSIRYYTQFPLCTGACQISCYPSWSVPKANCTEEEFNQFPYRLLDWFLLLSRMGESYAPAAPPQSCLSHAQRAELAQVDEISHLKWA